MRKKKINMKALPLAGVGKRNWLADMKAAFLRWKKVPDKINENHNREGKKQNANLMQVGQKAGARYCANARDPVE